MQQTDSKIREYVQRILYSRLRILNSHGFYGLLLMHMKFGIDDSCNTAYTNGHKICFNHKFLEDLSNDELDFVMMHEIMHIVLKHCFRGRRLDGELFNIACDIVVNSNILKSCNMDKSKITLKKYGEAMHLAPNQQEGYLYTAEEVYEMLKRQSGQSGGKGGSSNSKKGALGKGKNGNNSSTIDDHSKWEIIEGDDEYIIDEWEQRLLNAAEAIENKEKITGVGDVPLGALRLVNKIRDGRVNWRVLLNDFLSFEVNDYSFTPPDKRYDDFFLPDFNELDITTLKVMFFIDTSGSMDDDELAMAYSEVKGALDQYNGKIIGKLGFFDYNLYEPIEFCDTEELLKIKPKGGGGTSFHVVFNYLQKLDEKPAAVIILTDGYAEFPNEAARDKIPVIWLINNDEVTPPWGIVARLLD